MRKLVSVLLVPLFLHSILIYLLLCASYFSVAHLICSLAHASMVLLCLINLLFLARAKVRNFLDMVDVQDLHSQLPLSSRSSSFSSTSSDLHPSSNGANKWMVGENIPEQILSVIQPTAGSEKRRREIIEYIQ